VKLLKNIDYAPLQAKQASWRTVIQDTFKLPAAISLGIFVAASILVFYLLGIYAFFIVGIFLAPLSTRAWTQKNMVWKQFAEANGWYTVPVLPNDPRFVPPGIMRYSAKLVMSDVVHAQFEGHECDVFLLEISSGSGRSKGTHYYTIARVLLSKPFPHIILDSKSTWALLHRGGATAKASLEGNFDKHFSLYHDPGEHIDALSIVTPDVMQTLLKMPQKHDIEIVDNYLFFMAVQDHRGPEALPKLLETVDALADQIAHKAKTFRSDKVQPANVAILASAIRQYGQSRDSVLATITFSIFFIFLIPLILVVIIGMTGSFAGY
jgi:hypothetical protein